MSIGMPIDMIAIVQDWPLFFNLFHCLLVSWVRVNIAQTNPGLAEPLLALTIPPAVSKLVCRYI